MASGGSKLKMSEETFDYICTSCADDNLIKESIKYCSVCKHFCCVDCVKVHKRLPILQGHTLLENSSGPPTGQHSVLPAFPTKTCSQHNGKILDMFCGNHGVVCCYVCVSIDHKSCKDLHSITDDIDKLYNKSETEETQLDLNRLLKLMALQQKQTDRLIKRLKDSRKSAVQEVRDYRTEINQILDKLEAESIKQLDRQYRKLELELLKEKQRSHTLIKELTKLHDLITKANKNRAQTFVCTNLGQQKSTSTEKEEKEREAERKRSIKMNFVPVDELTNLLKGLVSLGRPSVTISTVHSLYKAKKVADIDIELHNYVEKYCCIWGSCILDDMLLITDGNNDKLKRVNISTLVVENSCRLPEKPRSLCSTGPHEVAVACQGLVQFVSVRNKMSLTRQFKLDHDHYGIGYNKDKLYITDYGKSLYVYDMSGHLLQKITNESLRRPLFQYNYHVAFSDDGEMMYVADIQNGLVCLTADGKHVKTIKDRATIGSVSVCSDGQGNLFIANFGSNTINQFSEDGQALGVVVNSNECLDRLCSVSFHQRLNRMFVTNEFGNIVQVYQLS